MHTILHAHTIPYIENFGGGGEKKLRTLIFNDSQCSLKQLMLWFFFEKYFLLNHYLFLTEHLNPSHPSSPALPIDIENFDKYLNHNMHACLSVKDVISLSW